MNIEDYWLTVVYYDSVTPKSTNIVECLHYNYLPFRNIKELNDLVDEMSKDQEKQFLSFLRKSDLSPFTRAKLAGQIVDNNFFFKQEEDLVEE